MGVGPLLASVVRARALVLPLGTVAMVVAVAFVLWTNADRGTPFSDVLAVVLVAAVGVAVLRARADRDGQAFAAGALAVLLVPIWAFACLWPDVLPARNVAANTLTVHNASSSHYTLTVMTWVAAVLVPFVLLYQGWTYWVFRKRVFATHIPDHVGLTFARPAVPVGAPTSPTGRSAGSDGAPQA